MSRVTTKHHKAVISDAEALDMYEYLRDHIEWQEGVRSKHGPRFLVSFVDKH